MILGQDNSENLPLCTTTVKIQIVLLLCGTDRGPLLNPRWRKIQIENVRSTTRAQEDSEKVPQEMKNERRVKQ